jgi:lipopolysaccharide/colanic/teichoic acid biosynthesis glycosyltransferase
MKLGLRVVDLPDFYIYRAGLGLDPSTISLDSSLGVPAAVLSDLPSRPGIYLFLKRTMDILVAGGLLVLLSPLLALIAILIRLTSPGTSALYPWRVLGTNKKPFVSYKFRTMVPNAEGLKAALMAQNEMQGPVFKMKNDPRITPLGRWLRKFSLDELPQLYSVLKGDMSLVGPRPPSKEEADRYEFWQRRKLSVKPGITCLWQVNGRNRISSFDDWVRLDLEYIQNASLSLDCKLLLKTIPAVLRGRGAY